MNQVSSLNSGNNDISSTERGVIQNIMDEESKRMNSYQHNRSPSRNSHEFNTETLSQLDEDSKFDKRKEREQLLKSMKAQKEMMNSQEEINEEEAEVKNKSKKKNIKKKKRSISSGYDSQKYDRPRNDSVTTETDIKNAPQAESGFTEKHE